LREDLLISEGAATLISGVKVHMGLSSPPLTKEGWHCFWDEGCELFDHDRYELAKKTVEAISKKFPIRFP